MHALWLPTYVSFQSNRGLFGGRRSDAAYTASKIDIGSFPEKTDAGSSSRVFSNGRFPVKPDEEGSSRVCLNDSFLEKPGEEGNSRVCLNDSFLEKPDEEGSSTICFDGILPEKPDDKGRSFLDSDSLFFDCLNAGKLNLKEKHRRLPLPTPYKLPIPNRLPKSKRFLTNSPSPLGLKSPVSAQKSHVDGALQKLASEIQSLPLAIPVARVLVKWERFLKRGSLSVIIRDLGRMQLPSRVMQVIFWLQKSPRLWPDDHSLCAAIKALVDANEAKLAIELYSAVGSSSTSGAETLALSLARVSMFEEAVEVIKTRSVESSQGAATIIVKLMVAASSLGMQEAVALLLQELKSRRSVLKLEDCTAAMSACSKMQMHEEVESLFMDYTRSGLQANIIMYTVLMKARSRVGKDREAMAAFWEIQKRGLSLDLVAYQVIMSVLGRLKDVPRAAKLFSEMKHNNFSPTPDIYNTLLELYYGDGRDGRARKLLQEMQILGFAPDPKLVRLLSTSLGKDANSVMDVLHGKELRYAL